MFIMSKRVFNEYTYSIRDLILFRQHLADNTLTESTNEDTMTNNQYYHRYNHYYTFKSDGTKKCGIVFDLDNVTNGDFLKVSIELMSIEGEKPTIKYREGTREFMLNHPTKQEGFEFVNGEFYMSNRASDGKGQVFIGLDIGQSGKFRLRYPIVKHFSQTEYPLKSNSKMFQLSKADGNWKVDNTNSFRKLDPATLQFGSIAMYIHPTEPFLHDVPQVFCMTNSIFAGWSVHFNQRTKNYIEIHFYDNDGVQKKWSEVPDGAVINLMAIAGWYY